MSIVKFQRAHQFVSDTIYWPPSLAIVLYVASYLIFVIFFTQAKFLEDKIYTEKRVNYDKLHSKLPILRVNYNKLHSNFSR